MDALQVETRRSRADHRLVIRGELDLASAPQLRQALSQALAAARCDVVVDVSQVRFADCTAVGVLLQVRRQAEASGRILRVAGAHGVVLDLLEIAGVAKRLGVYDQPAPPPHHESAASELTVSMLDAMSQLRPGAAERDRIRDRVVAAGMPFATSLARRFANRGEPFEDLRQVAMIGLLKAVDGYDPARGREFVAYAKPTILGELRRHFRDRTWAITVPRRHKELRLALNVARDELTQRLGRSPSITELAEHLQVGTAAVLQAVEAAQAYQSVSLSIPVGDGESGSTLADLVGGDDPELAAVENRTAVPAMIATLPEREQRILTMRFYYEMTQSQIASSTGVSQMHVSRLIKAALHRLRQELVDRTR
ncbi:MAG: SigB/SigF/SigG family RNA polymerase sigma factor [Micromonosporaceae bacterium]|nr:SigB/SigF/SigG family RNA polymerase sigma factor [Micromonosporaceae bacterium]